MPSTLVSGTKLSWTRCLKCLYPLLNTNPTSSEVRILIYALNFETPLLEVVKGCFAEHPILLSAGDVTKHNPLGISHWTCTLNFETSIPLGMIPSFIELADSSQVCLDISWTRSPVYLDPFFGPFLRYVLTFYESLTPEVTEMLISRGISRNARLRSEWRFLGWGMFRTTVQLCEKKMLVGVLLCTASQKSGNMLLQTKKRWPFRSQPRPRTDIWYALGGDHSILYWLIYGLVSLILTHTHW